MARIMKHVRYLMSCTTYVTEMRTRMDLLSNTSVDVKNRAEVNTINNKEVPTHVPGWLDAVKKTKADVDNIRVDGCLNLKTMYETGKIACKITQVIDRLIQENGKIVWTDDPIPLGRVISKRSSLSGEKHNNFESRDLVFDKALEALKPCNKTSMIALCGMGGVGKSTMMKQLRETVMDQNMFDWVFTAVIGEKSSLFDVQQAIADHMCEPLTAMTETTRADELSKRFNAMSETKKKILVILDDVWTTINLENIGLSPLPNQGVGIKFLLTSRNKDVCTKMGVEADSIFNVTVLSDPEAQKFFQQEVKISSDAYPELHQIGEKIVRKCGGLPIAIKTIALNLKGKAKVEWNGALSHLEEHDLDGSMDQIFRMSFKSLEREAKATPEF